MFCISASYKKVPVAIRQYFAFTEEEQCIFINKLIEERVIRGAVILSTCNRSELYFTGDGSSVEEIAKKLALYKKINGSDIKKYCLFYGGANAVKHLFNVTCGLDSMVLGEDEILRQVKEAYLDAAKANHTDGELNIIFQDALNCAKSGKSRTRLSTTPVSVATITANTIEKYIEENNFTGSDRKVMVIGITGKTGGTVARDLISKGIPVIGTSRRHRQEDNIYGSRMAGIIGFKERYMYINQVCAIASATTSPHYTLTYEEYLKYAGGSKKQLLIDLAVPYDIDRALAGLKDIKLLDIDYFNTLSNKNINIKLSEISKAEEVIAECVENTMKKIYMRKFLVKLKEDKELESKFNNEKWLSHMVYYLKDILVSSELKDVLERIYNRETSGGN